MADKSATLAVKITGDSKGAEQAFKGAAGAAESAGKRMGGVGTIIKGALGAQVISNIADKVGDFASESVNKFQEVGTATMRMQRIMGGSVEDVSRLGFAAQHSGLDTDMFAKSMGILSKNMVSGKAFQGLGVSLKDASGQMRPMAQLLPELADKFKGMPNGAEKSALALKLFGKAGLSMLPFLNKGSDGIKELMEQSDELGTTLSGSDLDAIKANTKAKREWNGAIEGLQIQLGKNLYPAMTAVTRAMVKLIPIVSGVLGPIFKVVGNILQSVVVPAIAWAIKVLGDLVTAVMNSKTIQDVFTKIGVIWEQVQKTVVAGVKAMVQAFKDGEHGAGGIIGVFQSIGSFARDLVFGFEALWYSMQDGDVTSDGLVGKFELVGSFIHDYVIPALKSFGGYLKDVVWPIIVRVATAIATNFVPTLQKIGAFIMGTVVPGFLRMVAAIMGFYNAAVPVILKVAAVIWAAIGPVVTQLPELFRNVWTTIVGLFKVAVVIIGATLVVLWKVIQAAITIIVFLWQRFGDTILSFLKVTWGNLVQLFQSSFRIVQGIFQVFAGLFTGDWGKVWTGIKNILGGALGVIQAMLSQAWNIVRTVFNALGVTLKIIWDGIWNGIKAVLSAALNGVLSMLRLQFNAVAAVFSWLWNNAIKPVVNLILGGFQSLAGTVAGLLRALSNVPGFGWAKDAANAMDAAARKAGQLRDAINNVPRTVPITVQFNAQGLATTAGVISAVAASAGRNAKGTDFWKGGLTWVGEEGPELVNLPRGSQVIPNGESMSLAKSTAGGSVVGVSGGDGGATVIVNVTVQGSVTAEKDLAKAIVGPIRDELVKFGRRNGGKIFPS